MRKEEHSLGRWNEGQRSRTLHASESPAGLIRTQIAGPLSPEFLVGAAVGTKGLHFYKSPQNADAAGQGPHFENH